MRQRFLDRGPFRSLIRSGPVIGVDLRRWLDARFQAEWRVLDTRSDYNVSRYNIQ